MVTTSTITALKIGPVLGRITLSREILDASAALAAQQYAEFERQEFSGFEVEDVAMPPWLERWRSWFPMDWLASNQLSLLEHRLRLYVTASASPHIDDMDGLSLIVVLFNDGLVFRQGHVTHCTKPGEFFILDDCREHQVDDRRGTTVYLCLSVPVRSLPSVC